MTLENFGQRLAKDAVDGLLRQAAKGSAGEVQGSAEVQIDEETKKKLIDREIKMAADPDFELAELAKRNAADRLRRNLDKPAQSTAPTPEPAKDKAAVNMEIGQTAKAMLDMGIPGPVVAQYLIGSSTPQFPVAFGGAPNQGLTITDVLSLVDRMNQNKPNTELVQILQTMREEIKALRLPPSAAPPDPLQQVENTVTLVKRLQETGLISTSAPAVSGEPIEVVKEKNRHAEKMEEIKVDSKFKDTLGGAIEDIPVNLGIGFGAQNASRAQPAARSPANPANQGVGSFPCAKCGATIFYSLSNPPPEIKCSKCGMVHNSNVTPDTPAPTSTTAVGTPPEG